MKKRNIYTEKKNSQRGRSGSLKETRRLIYMGLLYQFNIRKHKTLLALTEIKKHLAHHKYQHQEN